jgi:flagellar biosynthesis chaperone FliJ
MAELVWMKDKPTVPGWYWYRYDKVCRPSVCEVAKLNDGTLKEIIRESTYYGNLSDGEWVGPLDPPEEHNYEHMARECYPKQVGRLHAQLVQCQQERDAAHDALIPRNLEIERLQQDLARLRQERDEWREKAKKYKALEREDAERRGLQRAAKHTRKVASLLGKPYVGWKGIELALTEVLDERDRLRQELEAYKGGMLHDQLVSQQQLIETLRQRVGAIEALIPREVKLLVAADGDSLEETIIKLVHCVEFSKGEVEP